MKERLIEVSKMMIMDMTISCTHLIMQLIVKFLNMVVVVEHFSAAAAAA
jgi:hypothetical protein